MAYRAGNTNNPDGTELMLQDLSRRIEELKVQFNLYFTGELRVPPEKERNDLEKRIRNLLFSGQKKARLNLLIQNVSSKFTLYNNMWLKRLNELETGIAVIKRKPGSYREEPPPPKPRAKSVNVSLNSEDSFEKFFDNYISMSSKKPEKPVDKEQVINSIKTKLITSNLIDARVDLSVEKGKLKIKIKGSQ